MKRSAVAFLSLAVLIAPLGVEAQSGRVYRVGLLSYLACATSNDHNGSFRKGLLELGYAEGRNLAVECRDAPGRVDRFPERARELVALHLDVLVAEGTPASLAAKQATATVPIVMVGVADPEGSGLTASVSHPGGNVTGPSVLPTLELAPKVLQLAKEVVPHLSRIAVLRDSTNPVHLRIDDGVVDAGRVLGMTPQLISVRGAMDLQSAFATVLRQRAQASASQASETAVRGTGRPWRLVGTRADATLGVLMVPNLPEGFGVVGHAPGVCQHPPGHLIAQFYYPRSSLDCQEGMQARACVISCRHGKEKKKSPCGRTVQAGSVQGRQSPLGGRLPRGTERDSSAGVPGSLGKEEKGASEMIDRGVGMVSPKHRVDCLYSGRTEDRIDAYEARTRGWFLDHARMLLDVPDGEMAALHLMLAYLESSTIFRRGESSRTREREFFRLAFRDIFPDSEWTRLPGAPTSPTFFEDVADFLWTQLRCGLYHEGMTKTHVWVSRDHAASIHLAGSGTPQDPFTAIINPAFFLKRIDGHLSAYIAALRKADDTSEIRRRFNAAWELLKPPIAFFGESPSSGPAAAQ
jgi:hypothetical protein